MAALARLVGSDAVAVVAPVAPDHVLVIAAFGVPLTADWLHPDAASIVTRALGQGQAVGAVVPPIPLGDGRTATSILAVPMPASGNTASALVALRVATRFAPPDAVPMARAAELVALELRSASRAQDLERRAAEAEARARAAEDDRRFALALYELSRGGTDPDIALDRALAVCTDVLGTDAAAVLSTEGDRVRVRASRPAHTGDALLPAHEAIDRVRRGGGPTLVRFEPGLAPSWAPEAREALLAPLGSERTAVLVLARRSRPFSMAEADGAMLLAAEIAPIVARAPAPVARTVPRRERFAVATTILLLAEAAILAGAFAYGLGTAAGLVLAGPIAIVAGGAARGGRIALLFALALSGLAFAERTSAPLLYGPRGEIAFALETGGAVVALAGVVTATLALRARRARSREVPTAP